ncbi:MAG TPA: glutamate synthase central domain-containing protein, partial [Thermomicrobiales bacterium]|nr:glutamate synthase central domain-containing protein [Thermomicrobiales bacterium]
SVPHALMMLVPEAWEEGSDLSDGRHAFSAYHAGLIEPWDGPAALGFSDGVVAGAALDRNGLRPLRYAVTRDGLLIAGSEAGTVAVDPAEVVEKGRLGPGQIILVDTQRGLVLRNDDLKDEVASGAPYAEWVGAGRFTIAPFAPDPEPQPSLAAEQAAPIRRPPDPTVVARQRAFGYTAEDLRLVVQPMAGEGKEPTWSMGDDAPLAVLSAKPRPLHAYFRQRFAQVTNPAIDSLRERAVMSLDVVVGRRGNLLTAGAGEHRLAHLPSVVLAPGQLADLEATGGGLPSARVSVCFPLPTDADPAGSALLAALDRVVAEAEGAVRAGASVIVLSDKDVDEAHAALPMVLAVGAVHHALIRAGLRSLADIVAETGEVNDVHALACLIGYGASAVVPYLALEAASALAGTRGHEGMGENTLHLNYLHSLEKGFLKVAAKMGISTAMGYRGAQVFETIGLAPEVVERAFAGTPARLAGIGFAEIETDLVHRHRDGFAEPNPAAKLPDLGFVRYRKEGEPHAYEPPMVKALQAAVTAGDREAYAAYRQ